MARNTQKPRDILKKSGISRHLRIKTSYWLLALILSSPHFSSHYNFSNTLCLNLDFIDHIGTYSNMIQTMTWIMNWFDFCSWQWSWHIFQLYLWSFSFRSKDWTMSRQCPTQKALVAVGNNPARTTENQMQTQTKSL